MVKGIECGCVAGNVDSVLFCSVTVLVCFTFNYCVCVCLICSICSLIYHPVCLCASIAFLLWAAVNAQLLTHITFHWPSCFLTDWLSPATRHKNLISVWGNSFFLLLCSENGHIWRWVVFPVVYVFALIQPTLLKECSVVLIQILFLGLLRYSLFMRYVVSSSWTRRKETVLLIYCVLATIMTYYYYYYYYYMVIVVAVGNVFSE